jgi:hypothetical protein
MLLVSCPASQAELVGTQGAGSVRSPGYLDKLRDVQVDEVIKDAAVQLNVVAWRHLLM